MGNLIRMDLYRMRKGRSFLVCLILTFALGVVMEPLGKLLFNLSKSLAPEQVNAIYPGTVNLSSLVGSPFPLVSEILVMLSAVFFFHADMENGYIKNIAGQMPRRGFSILSRYLAVIVHNAAFMTAGLAGNLIGTMLCRQIVCDSAAASGILAFLLKLLLLQSLCAVLLLVTASLRSKTFGVVMAVLFGLGALELLYRGIDSALGALLDKGINIAPCMPDTLLGKAQPDTLTAVLSSAVTIGIFLPLSVSVFDKRDVK